MGSDKVPEPCSGRQPVAEDEDWVDQGQPCGLAEECVAIAGSEVEFGLWELPFQSC